MYGTELKLVCPQCHQSICIKEEEMLPRRFKKCPHCKTEITSIDHYSPELQREINALENFLEILRVPISI